MKCFGSATVLTLGLMMAAVTTTACATTQTVGEETNDQMITRRVGWRLTRTPDVARYKIDVDALNGVVTLRGNVGSEQAKRAAEQVTRSTEGVRAVRNRLVVEGSEEMAADIAPAESVHEGPAVGDDEGWDPWIQTKVWSKMTSDPLVKKRNIDVDVEDGVVTLSGIVESQAAKRRAVRLATATEGVVRVIDELQVARPAD